MAIDKTILFYVNFSRRNFAQRVKSGEKSWEAVDFSAINRKKNSAKIPGVEVTVELDKDGFPRTGPPKGLLKNGKASLFEGLLYCKPSNYGLSSSDPMAIQLPNGEYCMCPSFMKYLRADSRCIWLLTRTCSYK